MHEPWKNIQVPDLFPTVLVLRNYAAHLPTKSGIVFLLAISEVEHQNGGGGLFGYKIVYFFLFLVGKSFEPLTQLLLDQLQPSLDGLFGHDHWLVLGIADVIGYFGSVGCLGVAYGVYGFDFFHYVCRREFVFLGLGFS